ncbi:TIGR03086 family metal-binding protein [Nocardia sp. NPDC052566]|uniref:TIGR03086 family metal-binding protein n=1 Tax=Nocardia sp. NPDC052566 TaxID=3364330 RepID=UPI0037C723E4
MTTIDRIDRAITMTAAVVGAITAEQLDTPSPCENWDLRTELNHLVGGMRIFAAQLCGEDPGAEHESDWLGTDPHGAYTAAAELDRAAWRRPDVLETAVRLGFGTVPGPFAAVIHLTELVVHGVDLAIATGRDDLVDQRLCAELLSMMRDVDFDSFRRPGMFGPELAAPLDAPPHRQLFAYAGRKP